MTFDVIAATSGRQPMMLVEVDVDTCSRVYGTAPCAAAIGTTGTQRCFNTRKTCQDPANFDRTTRTIRFSNRTLPPGSGITAIPSLVDVSMAPSKLDPASSLGYRASIAITLRDHPWHDFGEDPYVRTRAYVPALRGTYWGKMMARSPFYNGRTVRVKTGYLNADGSYDAANFQTRTYVLDTITGPDSAGTVQIQAKDVLSLADDDKAKAPAVNTGQLLADIDAVQTTMTLSPAGIGDLEYGTSGTLCIDGKECCTFARVAGSDNLTLVRGTDGTTADSHSAAAIVQQCLRYSDASVSDVVYDLLVTYGNVPSAFIDKPAWDLEVLTWISAFRLAVLITKPTGVNQLITELTQQALCYLWWDERVQLVEFRAVRPPIEGEVVTVDDDHNILADSVTLIESPDDRRSAIWIYYGLKDPTVTSDDPKNYHRSFIYVDLAAESAQEYGEQRIQTVFARWIPTADDSPARTLGSRMLARVRNNPRTVTLKLDAKDCQLWTGDPVRLVSKYIQSPDGGPIDNDMQVVQVTEKTHGTEYEYVLQDSFFEGRFGYVTEDDMVDYPAATDSQRRVNGFMSQDTDPPVFADGTEAYKII